MNKSSSSREVNSSNNSSWSLKLCRWRQHLSLKRRDPLLPRTYGIPQDGMQNYVSVKTSELAG